MDPPPPRHSKHYRPKQLETPSYTGGLNRSVEERIHENRRQHRSHHAGSESRTRKSSEKYESDWKSIQKGIEEDDDEWEVPEPINTPHKTPLITPRRLGGGQTPSRGSSSGHSTPYRKSHSNESSHISSSSTGSKSNLTNLLNDDDFKIQNEYSNTKDDEFDQDFYETEEGMQMENASSIFIGDSKKWSEKEERYKKDYEMRSGSTRRAFESEYDKDRKRWEMDRLKTAGLHVEGAEEDMNAIDESRVSLIIHDIKPPFLDSDVVLSKQIEMVSTVKDPNSAFARYAKAGSETLKEMIKEKEQNTSRDRFWNLSGTTMGNIMHLRDTRKEHDEYDNRTDEDLLYLLNTMNYPSRKAIDGHDEPEDTKQEASSEFSKTKTIKQQREYLPIFAVRDELMQVIRENQIIIVVGETGSGKTTQLTQYLYEEGYGRNGIIGCTQPRRVAAKSVAERVAEEVGCKLGTKVGYSIRFEDQTSEETVIKYMTDGILLKESLKDNELNKYSCVIMDEAHERSLNTDVLFGIFRGILRKRRDLKLIVTSATMNAERFRGFFGNAPIFNIKGRTFPVSVYYSKIPEQDYIAAVVKQVLEIHYNFPMGDVLVFMTGQADIECVCETLQQQLEDIHREDRKLVVLPMYSQLAQDKQKLIFKHYDENTRKCIVCTNIVETSLTLDGIIYVVDSGYCKLKVFNPAIGMDALQVTPISQANAEQRKGRAGRTQAGYCFRMYTKNQFYTELLPNQIPEIQRTNLSTVVLLLKSLGIQDLLSFDFMDPPPQSNLQRSMYQLWVLGALDNNGELTPLGRKMVEFPLDPAMSKLLIVSEKLGCLAESLIIVAMLSVPAIFFRPTDRAEESDRVHEKYMISESDHLTYLNVYKQWELAKRSKNWCEDHYIHFKAMAKAHEVYKQLEKTCETIHMSITSCGDDWDVVRKAICSAYYFNAAQIKGANDYMNMLNGNSCCIHPSSALFGLGAIPDYVVYHELVFTTKQYMHCVTAVEPEWLAEEGSMFFSIRESYSKRLNKKMQLNQLKQQMEQEKEEMKKKLQMEKKEEEKSMIRRTIPGLCTPGLTRQAIGNRTPRPKPKWKEYEIDDDE